MPRRSTERFDYLPAAEAEAEIAALLDAESDEAMDRYWERVMAAGRQLEARRGRSDWSREWLDDRDHVFKDDLPQPTYSPGYPRDAA